MSDATPEKLNKPKKERPEKQVYPASRFVHEFPLRVPGPQRRKLGNMFHFGVNLFNAIMGETRNVAVALRESTPWQETLGLKKSAERNLLFSELMKSARLDKMSMEEIARTHRLKCAIKDHLDDHLCQTIAARVCDALHSYLFYKKGLPRFKAWNMYDSIEGKTNTQSIRWRGGVVKYGKLAFAPIFDRKDVVEAHALNCIGSDDGGAAYCRFVRRRISGSTQYFVQVVIKGSPATKQKHLEAREANKGQIVGLDVNLAIVAASGATEARLDLLCPDTAVRQKKIAKIQRYIDRATRVTNPRLFTAKGKPKKGSKGKFVYSKSCKQARAHLADEHRRVASSRKTEHGELTNKLLVLGDRFKTEAISYKGWQKLYGKTSAARAPGSLEVLLTRKAENAGGCVERTPLHLALSQKCVCGARFKKKLWQRWHNCPECGIRIQRDLMSAYLAANVNVAKKSLDVPMAQSRWAAAEGLLVDAASRAIQEANVRISRQQWVPASLGVSTGDRAFRVKGTIGTTTKIHLGGDNRDSQAQGRLVKRSPYQPERTPSL